MLPSAPMEKIVWRRDFDPDCLAYLELSMWKAYYRGEPLRLFRLLVRANRHQARVSLPRALAAAFFLARGAVGFSRASGGYERYLPDIAHAYGLLALEPEHAAEVAKRELHWWVVRRDIGLASGHAAGEAIAALYAALYHVPEAAVAEAGALRGQAAEVRDRGAADDPDGATGAGGAYWPEVARLLYASYRSLHAAVAG
jgi:hypothetical protein